MLKVLHLTNNYPTDKNADYGVFTKDQIDKVTSLGVHSKLIFINSREKGIVEYWRAFREVRAIYNRYEIVHCFHGLTLIIAFFATRKTPILISFQNPIRHENEFSPIINKAFIFLYNCIIRSNRVSVIFKDTVPTKHRENKRYYFLPNGVDLNAFYPKSRQECCQALGLDVSKTYVLYVSSKDLNRKQKRYDVFVNTMIILQNRYPDENFEMLLLSGAPRSRCIDYFNAASVHLLTSDYEGSPNSVKESLACNTPVVSTDVGNVADMLSGISNCYVGSQEPNELARLVLKAIKSDFVDCRSHLATMGLTGEQKAIDLMSIYQDIIQ